MRQRKNMWLLLVLLVLLLVIASVQLWTADKEENQIPRDTMKKTLESRYAGSVTSIVLVDEAGKAAYKSVLQGKTGTYEIRADAYSGHILHISPLQIHVNHPSEPTPVKPSDPANPQSSENAVYGISLEQAKAIALKQVEGVFYGIEIEEVGGVAVYEVEVDTPNGQEVKVQVDAHTGVVLSVLWED
ncbi:PepSY domain-containing protein [Brevibacillus nitrificans]|uniref:PepSY domain-containing protein n=1 Tax=Brevibacillus nitrificans TaxID=651560 RepID=UPI00285656B3|nr:PepSY domain-containing protein [Brevibacillus nitrificans]MDR7319139.1 putative membrane protein YkoI [Brevibacillus nitrificans]